MADMKGKRNRTRLFSDLAEYAEWIAQDGAQVEIVGVVSTGISGHDVLVTYCEPLEEDSTLVNGIPLPHRNVDRIR